MFGIKHLWSHLVLSLLFVGSFLNYWFSFITTKRCVQTFCFFPILTFGGVYVSSNLPRLSRLLASNSLYFYCVGCYFSPFISYLSSLLLTSLAKDLSILLIFPKNLLLVSVSISFMSSLIFIISFFLWPSGFVGFSFSSSSTHRLA